MKSRIRRTERTAVHIAQKVASKSKWRAVPLSRFQELTDGAAQPSPRSAGIRQQFNVTNRCAPRRIRF